MKKKKIIIGICLILIIILSVFLYKFIKVKTAKIEVVLVDDLKVNFLDDVKISSFIKNINGKLIDDAKIDTRKLGKQNIFFEYINDDNIKVKYTFDIEVVDKIAPVVWLGKSYNVVKGSEDNLLDKILCGDNYDDNPVCEIIGDYNLNEVGSYSLVFKATDSSGNVTEKNFSLNVNEPKKNQVGTTGSTKISFSDVVKDYKTNKTEIGIDVSKWQGDIDFEKLKNAGVEFIIIRVGSSSGKNGENFVDSKFVQNIQNANAAGIPVGIYFYSYASTKKRAISDAKWIIKQIKDYKVDLPIAFDWENWNSFNSFDLSFFSLTEMATSFLDTLKDAGYEVMLYSSKTYLENIWFDTSYPVWLAHYTKNTNYSGNYEYWQLCSNGKVDGIDADVDINIRYLD